ncbi:DUF3068 domain-containing protein [Actinoplanes sp. NPDC049668]|uniref:DUF3068 domain-containing protein n=1 Tax=unclassified Actinoplanes TaxID=2626549 RepID=UPI0033AD0E33
MRSRVVGALLVGFGVLALVFAGGLAFVVAPQVAQLPYDMQPTQSVAEAPNAEFLQITNGVAKINTGTLRSTIRVQPDSKATADLEGKLDGTALVWVVGQEVVRTDTNEVVSAYSTSLAVDRKSGAAVDWDKQWLDTGNDRQSVEYAGQTYKFPFGTEKKSYDMFDRDLLKAQPMQFVKTEQMGGLETYQFTQEIRDETLELPADRLAVLLGQLLPGSTTAELKYSNTRTVWVDPTTGQYISVQERQQKQLVTPDGKSVTLLNAVFSYTNETVTKAADTAKSNGDKLNLVGVTVPIGLTVLGLILLVLGTLLVVRGRRQTAAAAQVPAQRKGGRHVAPADADEAPTEALPTAEPEKSGSKTD